MSFTTFNFLVFFPVFIVLYYFTPIKFRWITILVGSYLFYINLKPVYALLLIYITFVVWVFSWQIAKRSFEKSRGSYLAWGIILVLLPLTFFKYYIPVNNWLINILRSVDLRIVLPDIKWILPIGISFYTFMAISYLVDTYNEEIEPEKNIGLVALFLSFFPLILSGPIERPKNLMPQFKELRPVSYSNITKGLKLLLWGYFMKLVVADRIGIYVDAVYSGIDQHSGSTLLLTSLLYPFQVYADLGGYSLIAIGVAKIMGINVIQNFNRPFFARSMSDFWRRWHISLISWLTDYIYTPIAFTFRRYGIYGIVTALLLTFLISGIWHGAAITFVVWGLLQGVFLSFEALTNRKRTNFERRYNLNSRLIYIFGCTALTFLLFSFSQIFGRAPNMHDASIVVRKIFTFHGPLYLDKTTLTYSIIGLSILLLKDFIDEYFPDRVLLFENKNIVVRYISYFFMVFMILLTGILNESQFIYFKI